MKKLKNPKVVIAVLSVLLFFSLSANVFGNNGLIEITAYLNNGIKVTVNGEPFEPVDPNDGTKYVPITYKGRTYLPLRAVAEAVGLEVVWDAQTNTAHLGSVAGEIAKEQLSWTRVTPEYAPGAESLYHTKSRQPEYLDRAPHRVFEYGYSADPEYYASITIFVNTNFEYDKFKATFWLDDDALNEDGSYRNEPYIAFYDEFGSQVKVIRDVEWGKVYEIEVDIKDVQRLEVRAGGGLSIIGEPMLGK